VSCAANFPNRILTRAGHVCASAIVQGIDPDALAVPQQDRPPQHAGRQRDLVVRDDNPRELDANPPRPCHRTTVAHSGRREAGDRVIVDGVLEVRRRRTGHSEFWRETTTADPAFEIGDAGRRRRPQTKRFR